MLQEYVDALLNDAEEEGTKRKKVDMLTQKVVKQYYDLDVKKARELCPEYVTRLRMNLMKALDITMEMNTWDGHMKTVLKQAVDSIE